jgi:hypothetical protein
MNIGLWGDRLLTKGSGILCLLIGGALLVQLPSFYKSEVDFKSKAISATGTVVQTRAEEQVIANGTASRIRIKLVSTVRFHTNQGKLVEFTTDNACSRLPDCENKTVSLLYNPSLPSQARLDSDLSPETQVVWFLFVSSFLLLCGICCLAPENGDTTSINKQLPLR